MLQFISLLFFFNDTATTEIYTLSLHDALPISCPLGPLSDLRPLCGPPLVCGRWFLSTLRAAPAISSDRKSTRLNSSHGYISYAVFCLKKKTGVPDSCMTTLCASERERSAESVC